MLIPQERVALISGANRGIGRAVASRLQAAGYRVSLGARRVEALHEAFGSETDRLQCHRFLAEDRQSHFEWVSATVQKWGGIDVLVNNAGITSDFSIEKGEEAELDHVWAVNCKAPLFMTRLCLPYLRMSDAGRIVNVASLSGKRVRNEDIAYNMTKHALVALSHGTRRIGWEDGVRVSTFCPSFVRTDMTANVTKVARQDMIPVDDLAELVATAIALPNNACVAEFLVNCRLEDLW